MIFSVVVLTIYKTCSTEELRTWNKHQGQCLANVYDSGTFSVDRANSSIEDILFPISSRAERKHGAKERDDRRINSKRKKVAFVNLPQATTPI